MKIVTVQFDYDRHDDYKRMFSVFAKSCHEVMPGVKFEPYFVQAPAFVPGMGLGKLSNAHKFRIWMAVMEKATETVAFMDCDMMALRSIEDADRFDFDLAYTRHVIGMRRYSRIPFNNGLIFVKPTKGGLAIMRKWNEIDELMFNDAALHRQWKAKYPGMNQTAFGYLLERHPDLGKIIDLPCPEWNSCCDRWHDAGPDTRIVHIKGDLRRALMHRVSINQIARDLWQVARKWREYEEGKPMPDLELDGIEVHNTGEFATLDAASGVMFPKPEIRIASSAYQLMRHRARQRRIV